jgi:G:T-mismatch repair DNA endonuclease (very short patch repair protein)
MLKEWDYIKNTVRPEKCTEHSSVIVWWVCDKGHEYQATIAHKTRGGACYVCPPTTGYSRAQITWLEDVMKQTGVIIRHALSPEKEFKIPGVGRVDGYCAATNTVYEFHGDFWHGNLARYDPNDMNNVKYKSYGELFTRTLQRDAKIRSLGYNLIVKWETDFTPEEIPVQYRELLT